MDRDALNAVVEALRMGKEVVLYCRDQQAADEYHSVLEDMIDSDVASLIRYEIVPVCKHSVTVN